MENIKTPFQEALDVMENFLNAQSIEDHDKALKEMESFLRAEKRKMKGNHNGIEQKSA